MIPKLTTYIRYKSMYALGQLIASSMRYEALWKERCEGKGEMECIRFRKAMEEPFGRVVCVDIIP